MTCVGGIGSGRYACPTKGPSGGGPWTERDDKRFRAAGWYLWPKDCAVEFDGTALCPRHRNPELEARIDASSKIAMRAAERAAKALHDPETCNDTGCTTPRCPQSIDRDAPVSVPRTGEEGT